MDDSLSKVLIRLPKGAARRVVWRRGDGIAVLEGQVWVTEAGSADDTVLGAGQSHTFDGSADLVVEAFADAVLIRLRADGQLANAALPAPARG